MLRSVWNQFTRRAAGSGPEQQRSSRRVTARPVCERLEVRDLPATLLVHSLADPPVAPGFPLPGAGTLRRALLDYQAGDTIDFDPNLYGGTIQVSPVNGAFQVVQTNLTVEGRGITLDGQGMTNIFTNQNQATTYTLQDFNFVNGKPAFTNSAVGYGGAIYNVLGTVTVRNCNFTNNVATSGGAIYVQTGSDSLTVDNCNFTNNSATTIGGVVGGPGGAIECNAKLTVTNSYFKSNASSGPGGGIDEGGSGLGANAASTITVSRATFDSNSSSGGGGGVSTTVPTTITASVFQNNSARAGNDNGGGALRASSTTSLFQDYFNRNRVSVSGARGGDTELRGYAGGGAIFNDGTMTIADSEIDNNIANYTNPDSGGGGIYNHQGATLNLNRVSLTYNEAVSPLAPIPSTNTTTITPNALIPAGQTQFFQINVTSPGGALQLLSLLSSFTFFNPGKILVRLTNPAGVNVAVTVNPLTDQLSLTPAQLQPLLLGPSIGTWTIAIQNNDSAGLVVNLLGLNITATPVGTILNNWGGGGGLYLTGVASIINTTFYGDYVSASNLAAGVANGLNGSAVFFHAYGGADSLKLVNDTISHNGRLGGLNPNPGRANSFLGAVNIFDTAGGTEQASNTIINDNGFLFNGGRDTGAPYAGFEDADVTNFRDPNVPQTPSAVLVSKGFDQYTSTVTDGGVIPAVALGRGDLIGQPVFLDPAGVQFNGGISFLIPGAGGGAPQAQVNWGILTAALTRLSPARDRGDVTIAQNAIGTPFVDERGVPRSINLTTDIGAYEFQIPLIVTVSTTPNPSLAGTQITFSSTLTVDASGVLIPLQNGTVTYYVDGTLIGISTIVGGTALSPAANVPNVPASGLAQGTVITVPSITIDSAAFTTGSHTIWAVFNDPTGNFAAGTPGKTTQTIFNDNVIITGTPLGQLQPGSPLSLQIHVAPADTPNALVPGGKILIVNAGVVIGQGTLDGNGNTTITIASLPANLSGSTVVYSGDLNFNAASIGLLPLVSQVLTNVLSVSPNPAGTGDPVTLTDTLTLSGVTVPGGTVTFIVNGTPFATVPVNANGVATLVTTTLPVGLDTIVSVYSGDGAYPSSTSNSIQIRVKHFPITTGIHYLAVASDAGKAPEVKVYNANTGSLVFDLFPYPAGYLGGVRVAVGDIEGNGVPDIVTVTGPGGGPIVNVYSGTTGQLIHQFYAFSPFFRGGAFIAVGDVNGDGYADIVVGADAGGGPQVQVFDGTKLDTQDPDGEISMSAKLATFYAYSPEFHGGVRVAVGDILNNGFGDIVTGAGPGGGPQVTVFDASQLGNTLPDGEIAQAAIITSFYAYDANFKPGIYVATGDVNGDGFADIIVGPEIGGGPQLKVFDGKTFTNIVDEFAYNPLVANSLTSEGNTPFSSGLRVASFPTPSGSYAIAVVPGRGVPSEVKAINYPSLQVIDDFFAFDLSFLGGSFIGGA